VFLWALLLRARWWPWGLCGCSGVWFPLLYFNKKKAGFGRLYARRARHKCCALYTPWSRFALVNFVYQTLVFRFLEFCLPSESPSTQRCAQAVSNTEACRGDRALP